ncbi:RNA-binding protein 39 [Artemisia annua]|uniref:RNA-binding protein 39 n=1 Tax=Artemisia annua TaxID=35608 RepID=A0A2U1LT30_ARTAN|nr:RNA-binding protein 39 [Artemisia annua]
MVKLPDTEENLVQSTATAVGVAGGARKVYVGNLHCKVTELQLRKVFESFGPVESVKLATDGTGKSKGFGFIQFTRPEDAIVAETLDEQLDFGGQMMKVFAITDQAGMQQMGVNPSDFDDDDGGGLVSN